MIDATRFFDATEFEEVPDAPGEPASDHANTLFGESTPGAVAPRPAANKPSTPADTEAEKAEVMFAGSEIHRDASLAIQNTALEDGLSDPETAAEMAEQWTETFNAFQLNASESAQLTDIAIASLQRPATPELVAQWVEQSKQAIIQEIGPQGAASALADAQLLIERYGTPELIDILNSTGLGNHPNYVRAAVLKARAMRRAGKL